MEEKKKIIAVVGPTATGKSALAVSLAEKYNGEIISLDSMQIYKGMDVGTAKVTNEETKGIKHRLIDVCTPETDFSCAEYKTLATAAVDEITAEGKLPIVCGGTGLYLDCLLRDGDLSPSVPDGIRQELEKLDCDTLYAELERVDPISAAATHKNNVKRVIRALEIYKGTGVPKSVWDEKSRENGMNYDALILFLTYGDRQKLYAKTDARVDKMLENGLVDECKRLDLDRSLNSAQAIGYKEIYSCLDGNISFEEAVELIKKNTRNYAKRQITWFNRYDAVRLYVDGDENILAAACREVDKFLG